MLKAFFLGIIEFRCGMTTNFGDCGDKAHAYDCGRELAHKLTLRIFDRN